MSEILVGLFLIFAVVCFTVLAIKVSGLTTLFPGKSFQVTAMFEDIGSLKVRAPVKISGVQIGQVSDIALDRKSFKALITMQIDQKFNQIPDDSSAAILTSGLLGDNYIAITPMYSETFFKDKSQIEITQSAMVLEKLIGQLIYKLGNNSDSENKNTNNTQKTGGKNASV